MQYQIIVSNLGTVWQGEDMPTALARFASWREASQAPHGRASGESVTLLRDDEIIAVYYAPDSED